MRFPRNLFEWSSAFKDDLGFEPSESGAPTDAPPGSPAKIAILRERIERGYRLWVPKDHGSIDSVEAEEGVGFAYMGNERYGAVVGKDRNGHKHRYAIWGEMGKDESPRSKRVLYVTAYASYCDSFVKDPELAAIHRHAGLIGATFVAVVPLFSARIQTEREMKDISEPITEVGFAWIRWMARHVGRVVVCWGESPQLQRHVDVLWLLDRTRKAKVFAISEGDQWPPQINRQTGPEVYKFEYRSIVAEVERLEMEAGGDLEPLIEEPEEHDDCYSET